MNIQIDGAWSGVVVLILSLTLVIFWEFRFQSGQRRVFRLACSVVALTALGLLCLKPTLWVDAPLKSGVIFTDPIVATAKDSLLERSEWVEISSPSELKITPNSISNVLVKGDGLETWQLEGVLGYHVDWQPAPLSEGITAIYLPQITENIPFDITGDINVHEEMVLTLIDPEGESMQLDISSENATFQFSALVKSAGLFQYRLVATRGQDTVFAEMLPVQVKPSRQANLLLLGSAPSFEWNYLKNHLADLGFGIASRFQLSTDIFHTEFLNMPRANLNRIDGNLLERFKLVIMDGATFEGLNNRQKRAIYDAVELAQVGLFLMVDDLSVVESIIPVGTVRGAGEVVINTSEKQIPLLKMPFSISGNRWKQVLFQGQEIGAFANTGIGKIGFGMVANSHVLELQGAPETYGQYWDQLLSPIIGFDISDDQFHIPPFNFINRQTDISFSFFGMPEVAINGECVPAINSPIRPDYWTVSYWPKQSGWHKLQIAGEEQAYFFVHNQKEWEVKQRYEKQQYNRIFFATNEYEAKESRQVEEPISGWIPWVMFLLSITGLWLERKLS